MQNDNRKFYSDGRKEVFQEEVTCRGKFSGNYSGVDCRRTGLNTTFVFHIVFT